MANSLEKDNYPPIQLKGFWLNLPEATQRNELIIEQLNRLGIKSHYSRIEASHGTPTKAKELGIRGPWKGTPGKREWGAWKGWLQMLKAACRADADVIHLMEDDIEITPEFLKLINWSKLKSTLNSGAIICTDGYCSPNQVLSILAQIQKNKNSKPEWQIINEGLHIPCINSILITPDTALKLLSHLTDKFKQAGIMPPVDVAMKDFSQGWLTLAPFCTGPSLKMSKQSTIRLQDEDDLVNSRVALTLLRCCLMSKIDREQMINEFCCIINSLPEEKFTYIVSKMIKELSELGHIKAY